MLAAATSLFSRSQIYQSYAINATPSSTPSPPGSSLPAATLIKPFQVGLWKVQTGYHKTTNKRVSVWSVDKRNPDVDRLPPAAKEQVLSVLKAEAQALRKLRHPYILEMVEPLEETRSELIFATESILSPLSSSIKTSPRDAPLVELDEIEIQKGILQLCKALTFLHDSAKMIHSNINPYTVIINAAGDWKLGGLAFAIPLVQADGSASRWEFPQFESRLPAYVQRSFDYMAPEYAVDEELNTMSDAYSLGCLIYAVHVRGQPPHRNHGSLQSLRENAGQPLPSMQDLEPELQALLRNLITRTPHSRLSISALPTASFFSSLQVSTLNFLDRATFSTKPREEKVAFMKGLTGVLDRFSDSLKQRKLLPSLVEEMKDVNLIPVILPNIFAISQTLSSHTFSSLVLPGLKPLFALRDPPQNMLTLLENLTLLQEKTEKPIFKEHILPLVYNALESEHSTVQERALKSVPSLCETIDYAEVQGVLFPRVAVVFSKTKILSVKISTLECFLAMVPTLDQGSLTQKLVPLLSKIRTRVEPSVMLATLNVQEAMGMKVDREAVATLVLPQLWTLSMGPMLNLGQFSRFMDVIRKLGERVEREHTQFLKDHQRIEDKPAAPTDGPSFPFAAPPPSFENLVTRSSTGVTVAPGSTQSGHSAKTSSWDDDVWGSILNTGTEPPSPEPPRSPPQQQPVSNQSRQSSLSAVRPTQPLSMAAQLGSMQTNVQAAQSSSQVKRSQTPSLSMSSSNSWSSTPLASQIRPPQPPTLSNLSSNSWSGITPTVSNGVPRPAVPSGLGNVLVPMKPTITAPKQTNNNDWADFDPLS